MQRRKKMNGLAYVYKIYYILHYQILSTIQIYIYIHQ